MKLRQIQSFFLGTLRGRLIISVALIHAVMMSLFILDLTSRQRALLQERQIDDARSLTQTLATTANGWILAYDISGLQELVDAQVHYPGLAFAIITDENGHILAHTNKSKVGQYLLDLPIDPNQFILTNTMEQTDVVAPAMNNNKLIGWARVGLEHTDTGKKHREITISGIIYALAAILIGVIIAWFMGLRITKRLYAVQNTINLVKEGDHSARSQIKGSDEAAQLANEFNDMLNALADREKMLSSSEKRFEKLFNVITIPMCFVNDKGELSNFNNDFSQTFGYTVQDIPTINEWWQLAYPNPEYRAWALANWEEAVDHASKENSDIKPAEYKVCCKSGEMRDVLISGTILNGGILGTFFDITDLKRTQQELTKSKEKAEESDRLKTSFLQNMSHEIRTPLNAICGFSDMLNKVNISDEQRARFVVIIQNSSTQLLSIVSDILTMASIETKQETVNVGKVNVNNIIAELLSIFKQQAQNTNVLLTTQVQLSDKHSEVYTDKTKVTQILTNFLTNALKFTDKGFIEFGYNIKKNVEPNELEFYVKDSGIGIEPEFHEMIFERFRQADKSTTKLYGGTGLGLTISKAFAELLGGKISVQSEPGCGSTFSFTIPYKPVDVFDEDIIPIKLSGNFETILVAEDDDFNYLFLNELLSSMNYKLIHAKNGQEAVEICKSNPNIDLILMDIKMPKMDGHTAAELIKEFSPNLPIIAQSAYALDHEIAKYSPIFDDYLTKPIKESDLKRVVKKYISR